MIREFFQGFFQDKRLEERGNQILQSMCQKESAIANRYCANATEEMGSRRFMANERIQNQQLKDAVYASCREQVQGKRVLAFQDTSEVNYQKHAGRLSREDKELGPVNQSRDIGFFLHPTLVVDEVTQFPLGFSSIQDRNRDWKQETKKKRNYKKRPIEEKESYRWIESALETKHQLPEAQHILIIGDRECDIYEELVRVPDARCDVLFRCAQDRTLYDREETLFAYLEALPSAGEKTVEIQRSKKHQARSAQMEMRYAGVRIACPADRPSGTLPPYVEVTVLEIREKAESVPEGEEPILWRLVTTLVITTLEEAWQCARWYALRWWIEEVFRLLKKDGLHIEGSQLEGGLALKRLAIMALQAALQILQLTKARAGTYAIPPETVFTPEELAFQEILLPRLEGKTAKRKNPHPRSNLAWSSWIIACLGGWKTYYSRKTPPGPITMKRGLERFYQQFAGWCAAYAI